jgi:hypothetical protein
MKVPSSFEGETGREPAAWQIRFVIFQRLMPAGKRNRGASLARATPAFSLAFQRRMAE